MHARRRGKSGSKRPVWVGTPQFVNYSAEEIEKLVIEKAREGFTSAQIGLVLRDTHGIPSVNKLTGKRVSKILKENELYPRLPEDLASLIRRALRVRQHLEENKNDLHSRRGLTLIESKIRRLVKYYRSRGVLESDFRYRPEMATMYLR